MGGMTKIIDEDFLAVMRELPQGWRVDRWDRCGMGWVATIRSRRAKFRLTSDRGYISVERIVGVKKARWREESRPCVMPEQLRCEPIPAKEIAELILANEKFPPNPAP